MDVCVSFTWGTDGSRMHYAERQAGGGIVMFWTMIYWETLDPGIHVDATSTCTVPPTFVEHMGLLQTT